MAKLHKEEAALQAGAQDDDQKKKIELLQKQIETLEKLVKLLADQLKKQWRRPWRRCRSRPPPWRPAPSRRPTATWSWPTPSMTCASTSDAQERYGPQLPAPLKELFLPSGNSETPLSIYGALAFGYSKILGDTATAANGAGRAVHARRLLLRRVHAGLPPEAQ